MLTLSPAGAEFIMQFEGYRPTRYVCPAGKPTIGIGHVIRPGETFTRLSHGEALDLLMEDAAREAAPVAAMLRVAVKPHEADAIISLAFNCGGRAIGNSTLIRLLNDGLRLDAADQFLRWDKVTDPKTGDKRPLRGLTRRRIAERKLFLFADYAP
jgi:lysozyme